jgi:chlorosome envelope protein X
MKIRINDRECEAKTGDRLLDVARANHSHIGYFCGGNALCQTCYVKILEGAELLSPLSEPERSMLSDTLIREGTRMACVTTIEKPGTIRLLTTVEDVKRMTLTNPLQLPAYAGKMGWEALIKFTDTIAFQARREEGEYKVEIPQILGDVAKGIGDALQLVMEAVLSIFSPKSSQVPAVHEPEGAAANTVVSSGVDCCCSPDENNIKVCQDALHAGAACNCN